MKYIKGFILGVFASSSLFGGTLVYAHLNTDNSVNQLFRMVMGREATNSEKSSNAQKEVDQLINEILTNQEYKDESDKYIVDIYRWLLGRDPDPTGRAFWQTRGPLELFRGIKNSEEYKATYESLEDDIKPTYEPINTSLARYQFRGYMLTDIPDHWGINQADLNMRKFKLEVSIKNTSESEIFISQYMFDMTLANNLQLPNVYFQESSCEQSNDYLAPNLEKTYCFYYLVPKESNNLIFWIKDWQFIEAQGGSDWLEGGSDAWRISLTGFNS